MKWPAELRGRLVAACARCTAQVSLTGPGVGPRRLTSLDLRRSNFSDVGLLSRLRELRLLVMGEQDGLPSPPGKHPSSVTVLRDDAGYLGCSFKHSNLKHMCDRHAQRASINGAAGALVVPGVLEAE